MTKEDLIPWKPGQSGNPKGRPKGIKYITELYKEVVAEPEVQEAIKRTIREAITGEVELELKRRYLHDVACRTEGMPKQSIEAEVTSDLAITLDADIPVEEISNGEKIVPDRAPDG